MGLLEDAFSSGGFSLLGAAVGEVTATHTPDGGSSVSVTGVWVPDETLPAYLQDGEQLLARGILHLLPSVANVTDASEFEINGTTYAVELVQPGVGVTSLQLVARTQRRVGGAASRIQR